MELQVFLGPVTVSESKKGLVVLSISVSLSYKVIKAAYRKGLTHLTIERNIILTYTKTF